MIAAVPLIEVQKVRLVGHERLSEQEINLSLESEICLAVLGDEASGKSQLMRIMAGLVVPKVGRVLWQGVDLVDLTPAERVGRIGVLFRNPDGRFLAATPGEEVALTPVSAKFSSEVLAVRVNESLTQAGFDLCYASCGLFTLSASQRYRVSVAAVFAARPRLLLVDEPGAFLSDGGEVDFAQRLLAFGRMYATTIVIFTSRATRAALYTQQVVRLIG